MFLSFSFISMTKCPLFLESLSKFPSVWANPKKYEIEVQNIVASAQIPARLDLDKIALEVENSEYEPAQFPGVIYRMKDPKATFLLFGSGKVICTGTRKVEEVDNVVNSLFKKLKAIDGFKKNLI